MCRDHAGYERLKYIRMENMKIDFFLTKFERELDDQNEPILIQHAVLNSVRSPNQMVQLILIPTVRQYVAETTSSSCHDLTFHDSAVSTALRCT